MLPDVGPTKGPAVVGVFKIPKRAIREDTESASVDVHTFVDRARCVKIGGAAHVRPGAAAEGRGLEGQIHTGDGTAVVHLDFHPVVMPAIGAADDDGGRLTDGGRACLFGQSSRRGRSPWHGGHEEDQKHRNKASARGHVSPPSSSPLNASEHLFGRAEPLDWAG